MEQLLKTPKELGFYMPAEWEQHEATWLTWPQNPQNWFHKYESILNVWEEKIRILKESEPVYVCVNDEATEKAIRGRFAGKNEVLHHVKFFQVPSNTPWIRDNGPIFVVREKNGAKERAVVKWGFNSWGGKCDKYYTTWEKDNEIPFKIGTLFKAHVFEPKIILEGGSIDVNGKGALLTTEQCLLNKNRNPHLSRKDIEQYLKDYLGVSCVLWLLEGIKGDDTDGHIDDIARFINPTTVICMVEKNKSDPNYDILLENYRRLQKMRDQDGNRFTVIPIQMPRPIEEEGERLAASYANFYISNLMVLAPVFNEPGDKKILDVLKAYFPTRKIIPLEANELVWGQGGVHCTTQQMPAV